MNAAAATLSLPLQAPRRAADDVSLWRLYLLRALYLLFAAGLGLTVWPGIIHHDRPWGLMEGVVQCVLGAFGALSLLGLRYPLQMLPLVFWELGLEIAVGDHRGGAAMADRHDGPRDQRHGLRHPDGRDHPLCHAMEIRLRQLRQQARRKVVVTRRQEGWARILAWPRIRVVLGFAILAGLLPDLLFNGGAPLMLVRTAALAMAALLAFGGLERWPQHLPRFLPRWVVQVFGVALVMPVVMALLWVVSTPHGAPAFWRDNDRLVSFGFMVALAMLLAPWTALAALVLQKEAFARDQALAFALERSELARQAADARLHLLSAQVAPHFLFNTLANVQALVDARSPRAAEVLRSLTAYLRAAVPRLNEAGSTLGREVELVEAYLALMHMRMPDRLAYSVHADEAARALDCPPMTLLTLVENAVRHGIDPNEAGGRIDVEVRCREGRCFVRVSDTGVGLRPGSGGPGTGLSALRERLALRFGGEARLALVESAPQGVCATLDFPV